MSKFINSSRNGDEQLLISNLGGQAPRGRRGDALRAPGAGGGDGGGGDASERRGREGESDVSKVGESRVLRRDRRGERDVGNLAARPLAV